MYLYYHQTMEVSVNKPAKDLLKCFEEWYFEQITSQL